MSALDELRKLDDVASPGPWTVDPPSSLLGSVQQYLGDFISGDVPNQARAANAQLAALSHLLRPMAEALIASDECVMIENHDECGRCAVFAQLEDALK